MIEKQVNLLASWDHYKKTHTTLVGEQNQTTKLPVKNNNAPTASDTGQLIDLYNIRPFLVLFQLNCVSKLLRVTNIIA